MGNPRKLTANFVATMVDDELLIVDLDGGELLSLSGTALEIWDQIDGNASEAAIVQVMAERYSASPEELAGDVAELIHELEAAALVSTR